MCKAYIYTIYLYMYERICYVFAGGTSAYAISGGSDEIARKYADCKEVDNAAICRQCAKVDESSTIMAVLTFIISFLSMVWSIYEVFAEERTNDSNNVELFAILKKLMNIIFAIVALASFRGCYDGMENDDEIIEVKSYKYGIGFISLILVVVLTVSAAIISVILIHFKTKSDVEVMPEELKELEQHREFKHTTSTNSHAKYVEGILNEKSVELNCDH